MGQGGQLAELVLIEPDLQGLDAVVSAGHPHVVLAHIDPPVRYGPAQADPFDPSTFEEEFRHALRATAQSGRVLEIDTAIPLHSTTLRWWHEEGGEAITFGSAHKPSASPAASATQQTSQRRIARVAGRGPGPVVTLMPRAACET